VAKTGYQRVVHVKSGRVLVEWARWCDGFASRMRGFTFRRSLEQGEGLVLVEGSDSRVNSGITMLFCFMDLGVIWVNSAGEVVDTVIARPWRPSYLPQAAATYAIEADPSIIQWVQVGDRIKFQQLAENQSDLSTSR
jgi:uncharacterized membrane protein (UPF0127 family)